MSLLHEASLFSYREFKADIQPFVNQLDRGDYDSLREHVRKVTNRIRQRWPLRDHGYVRYAEDGRCESVLSQEWPLFYHGEGPLLEEEEVMGLSQPARLGYWLLLSLSEYLQPCPSPRGNWSVLQQALEAQEWSEESSNLLFEGLPLYLLLKPNAEPSKNGALGPTSPYWFLMRPSRGPHSGWLPTEDVYRLLDELQRVGQAIRTFDVRRFDDIRADNPIVVQEYIEYLDKAYTDTLGMLRAAATAKVGLFMTITI
jgi:hypothetical protein